ncbi:lantibiotic dehydratase family protein [Sunxiuqinia dokdonensis]|uniref:Lantibiotic dehydratase N-terminal domain-containing protein n=1 Tax=Sunxiuqinia dokdonensis TaxID=1409788 RepID=A0A0L8V555_9BACT|nr:lantibiotic dehydratase family protein [Sunxiuqinia dokdonensis]KOH43327.1 hypothetical protein NC99_38870 [Sunxiuqinia dokdonensis]
MRTKQYNFYSFYLKTMSGKFKATFQKFHSFIFRTSICPLNILNEECTTVDSSWANNSIFHEATFLASPVLTNEIQPELVRKKASIKLLKSRISLLKYYVRMHTRCTPFGLFAGCGVGEIGQHSYIELAELNKFKSSTRLDMSYLCALIQDVSKTELIKNQARYYPNTSLYESGKDLRYTEYHFFKAKRKFTLSQAEQTEYLQKVLQKAANGETIDGMANLLVDEDITIEYAREYINELINNQILASELDPSVTGDDLLTQFIGKLEDFDGTEEIISSLKEIEASLQNIDNNPIGRPIALYESVKEQLKPFETNYDEKYLFQSDLFVAPKQASVSDTICNTAYQAIKAFNRLTPPYENPLLEKFRKDFYKKYEDEEISLLQALDVEAGAGFGKIDGQNGDIAPLLEGVFFAGQQFIVQDIKITPVQRMLLKKYDDFLKDGQTKEIRITDQDLEPFPETWDDLPDTISVMIEVIRTEECFEDPLITMGQAGGSSASSLLGRFCYLDEKIHKHVKQITEKEQELNPDKVLAEIVHLPESRIGNILMRPVLREYEIPYLANPSVGSNVIPLADLMVSVPHGKYIKLWSKRLNKEVLPRLSCAHNFPSNSLPVYHFLCAMQTQGLRSWIGFNWGPILESKPFLPRVRYENSIFSPAIWNIVPDDTKQVPKIADKHFHKRALEFKKKRNIPDKVLLVQGDNKLLIDFNHELSVQMLFSEVKKKPFRLEEFLFDDQYPLVKRDEEVFTNQVILSFYKDKKPTNE